MMFLYTAIMTIIAICILPFAGIAALFGRTYLWRRFRLPAGIPEDGSPRVWIHAASVGEAVIAFSLAVEIRNRYSGSRIFVSTATETGRENVLRLNDRKGGSIVDTAFLAPVDHPLVTGRFVEAVKPSLLVLVETELWPWLIESHSRRGVPVAIINGKLGRSAFRRYMMFRKTLRRILSHVALICVQSRTFSKRFAMLGMPPERLHVLGNVKFDGLPEASDYDCAGIRRAFGIPETASVFVAGSTRPGEEKILAAAFAAVLGRRGDAVMVVAPRHLSRIAEVEAVLAEAGLSYRKRSDGAPPDDGGVSVLILDTMGELLRLFAAADVAFVGGSLSDFGGHNPLEPAALGVPVLFGPYMEQTGSKELLNKGAAALVHDEGELTEELVSLFGGGKRHRSMAEAGPAVVRRFKGTLAGSLSVMERMDLIRHSPVR
ncbi:MAG: 3-deoxy-D-manno-octulosonic acid transferase [Candidatus Latescibacteria bacterium]|nr:3-deoxy-D-manno-octulosonic acid transferase [Candidatus Latescibacterota bacterium]